MTPVALTSRPLRSTAPTRLDSRSVSVARAFGNDERSVHPRSTRSDLPISRYSICCGGRPIRAPSCSSLMAAQALWPLHREGSVRPQDPCGHPTMIVRWARSLGWHWCCRTILHLSSGHLCAPWSSLPVRSLWARRSALLGTSVSGWLLRWERRPLPGCSSLQGSTSDNAWYPCARSTPH